MGPANLAPAPPSPVRPGEKLACLGDALGGLGHELRALGDAGLHGVLHLGGDEVDVGGHVVAQALGLEAVPARRPLEAVAALAQLALHAGAGLADLALHAVAGRGAATLVALQAALGVRAVRGEVDDLVDGRDHAVPRLEGGADLDEHGALGVLLDLLGAVLRALRGARGLTLRGVVGPGGGAALGARRAARRRALATSGRRALRARRLAGAG